MKNKIDYIDEPIEARVINDFLSKPENFTFKERGKKITLTLTEKSLNFFKTVAKKHGASYHAMIRKLLDYYAANQKIY